MKEILKVITRHPGRNDGEYGFWEIWWKDGNKYYRKYYTTSSYYCRYCGTFRSLGDCCNKKYKKLNKNEIKIYEQSISKGLSEIDLTLHKVIECKYDGGCVICYPCNHTDCNPLLRRHDA